MTDHVQDTSRAALFNISRRCELPAFVKDAELLEPDDLSTMPTHLFADPARKRFPIHTKADTWLSAAFFAKQAADDPDNLDTAVAKRLDEAVRYWKLDKFANQLVEQLTHAESVGPQYPVTYTVDGTEVTRTAVHSAEELHKLAADITTNKHRYPYETRAAVSRQLLDIAPEIPCTFQPEVQRALEKTAGRALTDLDTATAVLVGRRAYYTRYPTLSEDIDKAIDAMQKSAIDDLVPPAVLTKVAGLVDAMDRFVSLHRRFGHGVQPIEDELFTFTNKDADDAAEQLVPLANNTIVRKEALHAPTARTMLHDVLALDEDGETDLVAQVQALPRAKAALLSRELA